MEISIDEIVDYSRCPMFYFFKHKHKLTNDKIDLIEKYEDDLKKVIFYSFAKLQEGEFIRIEDIKQMWGKLWVKDKRKSDIIFTDSNLHKDTYNIKRLKGLECLIDFRDYLFENSGYPIAINQEYKIKIDDITLTGKFEVIREIENKDKEKIIQVCLFRTDKDVPRMTNRYDLKLHCDALALEQITNQNLKLNNMIYYLDKGKISTKNSSEMERKIFLHNIKTITSLIKNDIFYMSVNDNCQRCTYKDVCASKLNTIALVDKGE